MHAKLLIELFNYWKKIVVWHHKMWLTPKPNTFWYHLLSIILIIITKVKTYHHTTINMNIESEAAHIYLGRCHNHRLKMYKILHHLTFFLKTYFEAYKYIIDNYHTISEDFIGIYLTYTYNTEGWVWNFGKLTSNAFLKLTGNITSKESSASHIVKMYMKNAYPHTVHRWNLESQFIKNPVKYF